MRPKAIDRYIILAVLPYLALGLAILTTIIIIQQTARFADILGSSGAPFELTLEVTLNLLPNILIFTLPMATLAGVATGFSRMGHDSELVAMRAAGVGTMRIILPTLFLGVLVSLMTFYVSFLVAPAAARGLRDIGLQAALYKLESPVEPKSFYTGMPGKVVYVREGDKETGQWKEVFIYWEEADGQVRLVTARKGRLDFSGDQTELVLEDASMTTLPAGGAAAIAEGRHATIEHSANMRLRDERLNISRSALTKRINGRELELDEMSWSQLSRRAESAPQVSARREASIALHKKLTLSLSPIIFAFFGAGLGLRATRGGRSHGVVLSLAAMLLYYLISLGGEQLGRGGLVAPFVGSWLAFCLATLSGPLLLLTRYRNFKVPFVGQLRSEATQKKRREVEEARWEPTLLGLLDRKIFRAVVWNFSVVFLSLILVFIVFTLFELLRFIAQNHVSGSVVARYLLFLLPFTCIAVAPVSALLSVLVTFTLMVRRSETTAWWAGGQSTFRQMLPCIFFSALLGVGVWFVQEKVMPSANRRQNALRSLIRSGAAQTEAQLGRTWISGTNTNRIYSFEPTVEEGRLANVLVFSFGGESMRLEQVLISPEATLSSSSALALKGAEEVNLGGQKVIYNYLDSQTLQAEELRALKDESQKPSEFDSNSLSAYIKTLKARGVNADPLVVALERKRVEPLYPLVMVLLGAPLALVFSRRSNTLALCVAVGVGLAFLGITNGLQQIGANGFISPIIAAWSPAFLFLAVGTYLISHSQT
jgi:LPS export ABC transporter permease LptF/LPS export ABC transporter permease LptG